MTRLKVCPRQQSLEALHGLTVLEQDERGQALNSEALGQLGIAAWAGPLGAQWMDVAPRTVHAATAAACHWHQCTTSKSSSRAAFHLSVLILTNFTRSLKVGARVWGVKRVMVRGGHLQQVVAPFPGTNHSHP